MPPPVENDRARAAQPGQPRLPVRSGSGDGACHRARPKRPQDPCGIFFKPPERLLLATLLILLGNASQARPSEENLLLWIKDTPLKGVALFDKGSWSIGKTRLATSELVALYFDPVGPLPRVLSTVFLSDGNLVMGPLEEIRKGTVSVRSSSLEVTLKDIPQKHFVGALFPAPLSTQDTWWPANPYAAVHSAALAVGFPTYPSATHALLPGFRNRVTLHNRDTLDGSLLWLRETTLLVEVPDQEPTSITRSTVRMIESTREPAPKPSSADPNKGPEIMVRMKLGDLLRGRLLRLDENALSIHSEFFGILNLPRDRLAALFPSGEINSGLTWLSTQNPLENKHFHSLHAHFPARPNQTCMGALQLFGKTVCDMGIGVHAHTELTYDLKGKPGRMFVAWVGMDDAARQDSIAAAQVLLDRNVAWKNEQLKVGVQPQFIRVPLGNAKKLTLLTTIGTDDDGGGDQVNWGWAAIVGQ